MSKKVKMTLMVFAIALLAIWAANRFSTIGAIVAPVK